MSYNSFKDFFTNNQNDIYIIECPDLYLKKKIKSFINTYFNNKYTEMNFFLNEASFQEVYEHLRSTSLFGEKFLIYVYDCGNYEKEIINLITDKKNFKNKIIFFFNKIKSKKLLDCSQQNHCFFSMPVPKKNELKKIIRNFFIKNNVQITSNIDEFILESIPDDLESLYSELRKIVDFHDKTKPLTVEHVKKIIFSTKEENIFHFIDCFFTKNFQKTLEIYNNLLQMKTDVEYILNMLINSASNLLLIKSLNKEKNLKYNDIQKTLKINPYAFKKLYEKLNLFSFSELSNILEKLLLLQYKIRISGKDREMVFKNFLIDFFFSYK
jgi:DNA polymerase III delta subunit